MKIKIGIIGCGVISHTYIRDIKRLFTDLDIAAVSDANKEAALKVSQEYGIPKVYETEELLKDPEISIVVNLTPPALHTMINLQALNAGKHVFCEKPLALNMEDARKVVELAREKNLKLGCAPDTFMGSSLSTCRKLLQDGSIGKPLYANTNMISCGVETWHPRPEAFYREGGGPIFDMGGYYFSALITMFGPVKRVRAISRMGFEKRNIYVGDNAGKTIECEVPTHYAILAEFKSGFLANMNFSFDIFRTEMPKFEVYGTEGTLFVPDPNMHGGTPRIYRKEQKLTGCFGAESRDEDRIYEVPEMFQNVGEYVRGIGVHDLAMAIEENRDPVAGASLALHVLDVMTSVIRSAGEDKEIEIETDYKGSEI